MIWKSVALVLVLAVSSFFLLTSAQDFQIESTTESVALPADSANGGGIQGFCIATTGEVSAVSTLQDDVDGNRGCVTVFGKGESGTWSAAQVLAGNGVAEGDLFGQSISADRNLIVVGSPGASGFSGAAYVFRLDANTSKWTQEARLTSSDSTELQDFGASVAVCGDLIVVGAPFDSSTASLAGAAYLFRESDSGWFEEAKLTTSEAVAHAAFGCAVSLGETTSEVDGKTVTSTIVAVGASEETGGADRTGATYVFRKSNETWTQQARLVSSDAQFNDHFGWAVSASGNAILVGAPFQDASGEDAGAAYLFRDVNGNWEQETKFTASDPLLCSHLGRSVALDGDRALVGAPAQCPGGRMVGVAYLYQLDSGSWVQAEKYASSDPESAAVPFGASISLRGTEVASSFNAEGSGEAQLFTAE